jgi:general secretion pathway protein K
MKRPYAPSGFALLLVLAVIALLGVITVGLNTRVVSHTLVLQEYANSQKAYALATSGVEIAKVALKLDAWENKSDSFFDRWAEMPKSIEDKQLAGTIALTIEDEAAKLNPNAFLGNTQGATSNRPGDEQPSASGANPPTKGTQSPGQANQDPERKVSNEAHEGTNRQGAKLEELQEVLERLFEKLGLDQGRLESLMDWLDRDDEPRPNGTERDFYQNLTPPYAPTNGPLGTLIEIRLIKGFDHETFKKLMPYLTVWSEGRVNVNTADKLVLESLSSKISPFVADDIIKARENEPLEDKAELQKIPGLSDELAGGVLNYMDIASSTFRILSTGKVGSSQETIECIVQRKDDGFTVLRWVWL